MPGTVKSWLARLAGRRDEAAERLADPADVFEFGAPSHQNAIDLLPGWTTAFPPQMNLHAGDANLYEDQRIAWAVERFGSLEGKRILELGPLEGAHTAMMERRGARRIDAVEVNKLSYLRCLVTKEAYDLRRSHFHLGDFVRGLQARTRYDFIVACGVLYHMRDPLLLLERMAARTDALYLWTHYFDDEEMPKDDPRRVNFVSLEPPHQETVVKTDFRGVEMNLHQHSYQGSWAKTKFIGGPRALHYWLEKAQLIGALRALGFDHLEFASQTPNHPAGPAMAVFARRT